MNVHLTSEQLRVLEKSNIWMDYKLKEIRLKGLHVSSDPYMFCLDTINLTEQVQKGVIEQQLINSQYDIISSERCLKVWRLNFRDLMAADRFLTHFKNARKCLPRSIQRTHTLNKQVVEIGIWARITANRNRDIVDLMGKIEVESKEAVMVNKFGTMTL